MRVQRRDGQDAQRATSLELFYDLVFVFAVTQVSRLLLTDVSWAGAGRATMILLAVWWSWNYTTWVTNELDPTAVAVRLLVIALMLGSLLMAVAIPESFGDRGLLFAAAYVGIQIGRHVFLAYGAAERGTLERRRAARILIWFVMSGGFWLAGALVEDSARYVLWIVALLIDYAGPLVTFGLPGLARIGSEAWEVSSEHFAERFQLFVIIALGETVVITGTTTAGHDLDGTTVTALSLAFLATAALWWLYFSSVATLAEQALRDSQQRTLLARDAYTYLHVVLIAGIIASAVGDELVIAHPSEPLPTAELVTVIAGPVIYFVGQALLRLRVAGTVSVRRTVGAVACIAVGLVFADARALLVAGALTAVLAGVVVSDQVIAARRRTTSTAATPAME